jgi:hypothetical protein
MSIGKVGDMDDGQAIGNTKGKTPGRWRPARAGLVASTTIAGFGIGYDTLLVGADCASTQSDPFGCLGLGLIVLTAAVPTLLLAVAFGLKGKGLLHSLAGSAVCLSASWWLTRRLIETTPWSPESDAAAMLVLAPLAGASVGLWAACIPGSGKQTRGL